MPFFVVIFANAQLTVTEQGSAERSALSNMSIDLIEWLFLICLVVVAFTSRHSEKKLIRCLWLVALLLGLGIRAYKMHLSHLQARAVIALADIRNMSAAGQTMEAGGGISSPTEISYLLSDLYNHRTSGDFDRLHEYRDRIMQHNQYFGYADWIWGRILSANLNRPKEARKAFARAEKNLRAVAEAAPENPYPIFYLGLVNLELGNETTAVERLNQALSMRIHLQSYNMLPIEFTPANIQTAEAYSRYFVLWMIWCEKALDDNRQPKACDLTQAWLTDHHVVSNYWPWTKNENGGFSNHISLTITLPEYPPPEPARHYMDIELCSREGVFTADSLDDIRQMNNVHSLASTQEHIRIYDLPDGVYGYGDPFEYLPSFINVTAVGLVKERTFPEELEIHKISNTNYYFAGYVNTNKISNALVRLYFHRYNDVMTPFALPYGAKGRGQYERPQKAAEPAAPGYSGPADGSHAPEP